MQVFDAHRGVFFVFATFALTLPACSEKSDSSSADAASSAKDAGGGSSMACYIDVQFRCKEFPQATADQLANLPVECSSASGALSNPAACPTNGFLGRCTVATSATEKEIRRFYTGADAAYEQDFCVNTAKGTWSTTF